MTQLSNVSQLFNDKLARATIALLKWGIHIDPSSTPLFSILSSKGRVKKHNSLTFKKPISFGNESLQYISNRSEMSAPSEHNTALFGELARAGVSMQYDSWDFTDDGGPTKVQELVTGAVRDILIGFEAAMFSNGAGSSTSIAGLRTAVPMADTGAYFNIPSTRTNFDSGILHYWATGSSRGARVSALLGASFVVTDFIDPDSGLISTLDKLKTDAITRKYNDWFVFCTAQFHGWLKQYLIDNGQIQASSVSASWLPKDYKMPGVTVLKAGGTFIEWNDMKFIPTGDLYSTTYDCIAIPMTVQSMETCEIIYAIPMGGGQKLLTKESMVCVWEFQRPTKGMYWEAPAAFIAQFLITGLSGVICLKGDGTFDSSLS